MEPKDEIKQKLDIVDFIGQTVPLKPAGRNFRGLCPFHSEKTPSFNVSPELGIFKCFGCQAGGDIFSFYMRREGVEFPEALRDLAKIAGVELPDRMPGVGSDPRERLEIAHAQAVAYYHFLLTKHEVGQKALEYLKNRGVTNVQIQDFKIGYAPEGWQGLTDYLIRKKGFKGEELEQAGLSIRGGRGFYDRFRGRLMFPLKNIRGVVVAFSGRIVPWLENEKSGGKYINSPETAIYHKSQMLFPLDYTREAVRTAGHVVVVEGELDALASLRAGVKAVVAVKGSALTAEQVKLLKRYAQTIILALDSDEAGITAAKRAAVVASVAEMQVRVVELTQGKDPDELVKTDPKAWREAVKTAVGVYDFFIQTAVRRYGTQTVEGKQAISGEIVPILNQIENLVVADHYIKQLASTLEVSPEVVRTEMQRQAKKEIVSVAKAEPVPTSPQKSRLEQLQETVLAAVIVQYPKVDWDVFVWADWPPGAIAKIIQRIAQTKPKQWATFAKALPEELKPQFETAFLASTDSQILEDPKELKKWLSSLAILQLDDTLSKLRHQLAGVDGAKSAELQTAIARTAQRKAFYSKQ